LKTAADLCLMKLCTAVNKIWGFIVVVGSTTGRTTCPLPAIFWITWNYYLRTLGVQSPYSVRRGLKFIRVKVKQSLYRTGQALRVPEVWGSQIQDSRDMKVVRLSALWAASFTLPPHRKYSWRPFLLDLRAIVWSVRLCK